MRPLRARSFVGRAAAALSVVAGVPLALSTGVAAATPTSLALASSVSDGPLTWATLPMGRLDEVTNTFWELFVENGGGRFTLVTPPGVADNGGLVLSANGSEVVDGFLPSQQLHFTPLATTTDGAKRWGTGILPAALASVPDALAPSAGGALALVTGPQAVDSSGPGLSSWHRTATFSQLAALPAVKGCGLAALSAIVASPQGSAVVGGSCTTPGQAAVLDQRGASWQRASVSVPRLLAGARIEVLRLEDGGATALFVAASGSARWLFSAHEVGTGGYVASAPFALAKSAALVSMGTTVAGGIFAIARSEGRELAVTFSPRGAVSSFSVPPETSTLAYSSNGRVEALEAAGSTLTVATRQGAGGSWTTTQVLKVPISYGSSG